MRGWYSAPEKSQGGDPPNLGILRLVQGYQNSGVPAKLDAGRDRREEEIHTLASMIWHAVMIGHFMQLAFNP